MEVENLSDFYASGIWNKPFKLLLCMFGVWVDYVYRVKIRRCLNARMGYCIVNAVLVGEFGNKMRWNKLAAQS